MFNADYIMCDSYLSLQSNTQKMQVLINAFLITKLTNIFF